MDFDTEQPKEDAAEKAEKIQHMLDKLTAIENLIEMHVYEDTNHETLMVERDELREKLRELGVDEAAEDEYDKS